MVQTVKITKTARRQGYNGTYRTNFGDDQEDKLTLVERLNQQHEERELQEDQITAIQANEIKKQPLPCSFQLINIEAGE